MNIDKDFPFQIYVNLGTREDRRLRMQHIFSSLGSKVNRQAGIHSSWVSSTWGYRSKRRYACSLAKRLAIRKGQHSGAPAILLFEDDLHFSSDFTELLARIDLPDDWGIFLLGCRHISPPIQISNGLVKVARALDNHAMAIRKPYYKQVIKGLSGLKKKSAPLISCSDVKLSLLHRDIPTYAAYPNLVWQIESFSDTEALTGSNYYPDGRQATDLRAVRQITSSL